MLSAVAAAPGRMFEAKLRRTLRICVFIVAVDARMDCSEISGARPVDEWTPPALLSAHAALDKKLYRSLREAATSIRNVARRVEEPPPPKRTGRKALAAGVSAGAIAEESASATVDPAANPWDL